ncbi:hypothetical protein TNCV_1544311 [Trichonephila clavipes]|nr:hypothetical protein TNCV_1544311 [Trichonephila clavipes]
MMDTLGEEAPVFIVEPIFNSSLDLIIEKSPSLQRFLEWTEYLVVSRREIWAVMECSKTSQSNCLTNVCLARHSHMRTSIIDDSAGQNATSEVLDILSQFIQSGTVRGSIVSCTIWRHP